MKTWIKVLAILGACCLLFPTVLAAAPPEGKGPPDGGETAGNNLSYPVIWAEGVQKVLPGTPGMVPFTNGEWYYWWGTAGTDPDVYPLACMLDPDDITGTLCDDGVEDQAMGEAVPFGDPNLVKAFIQKDQNNQWQAYSGTPFEAGLVLADGDPLFVDWIDWGDNLESVDWYTRSQVRTEVVLFQDNPDPFNPWLEYGMRHVDGWGINEVHGIATDLNDVVEIGPGSSATVYSSCARLTIQLLLTDRDDPALADLVWVPEQGWTGALINPPIFNKVVYEAGDGPGYYNAEINVKGRIIYGYTWSVRKLHDSTFDPSGTGDYRITFSFDEVCGPVGLNTFFIDGVTQIIVPLEEEVTEESTDGESPEGGADGVLVPAAFDEFGNLIGGNFTYMDVRILERGGGGGGGGGGRR